MSEKSSRMFTYILQCKWFFRFLLGATRGNATCHVPSLLHAGWRSSNSWRLQRTQTSSDSSINWFTRISIWANDCFYSSCSLSQGHKFTQSCRATPCRLWLQPKSQSPEGQVGTRHDGMRLRLRLKALYERAFLLNSLSASTSNRPDYFDCLEWAARNWPLTSLN